MEPIGLASVPIVVRPILVEHFLPNLVFSSSLCWPKPTPPWPALRWAGLGLLGPARPGPMKTPNKDGV